MEAARRLTAPRAPEALLRSAPTWSEEEGGFALRLDGKRGDDAGPQTRSPCRTARLAEAIAAEWEAQGESIDPASMPVTRLANTRHRRRGRAAERGAARRPGLCRRRPPLLSRRRAGGAGATAAKRLGSDPRLGRERASAGASCSPRASCTSRSLSRRLRRSRRHRSASTIRSAWPACSLATTLTGSALIALALAEGALDVDAAWAAAHVDEDWNISQWGEDAEAASAAQPPRRFPRRGAGVAGLGTFRVDFAPALTSPLRGGRRSRSELREGVSAGPRRPPPSRSLPSLRSANFDLPHPKWGVPHFGTFEVELGNIRVRGGG